MTLLAGSFLFHLVLASLSVLLFCHAIGLICRRERLAAVVSGVMGLLVYPTAPILMMAVGLAYEKLELFVS